MTKGFTLNGTSQEFESSDSYVAQAHALLCILSAAMTSNPTDAIVHDAIEGISTLVFLAGEKIDEERSARPLS